MSDQNDKSEGWLTRDNALFTVDSIPPGIVGFVYLITRIDTGRMYIGQKRFTAARTRPPLKGRKRKRRLRINSDWQQYYGSNQELLKEVAKFGRKRFRRVILHLCRSKGEMNYLEMWEQLSRHVLLDQDNYYNEFCGGRIHRSHVTFVDYYPPLDSLSPYIVNDKL